MRCPGRAADVQRLLQLAHRCSLVGLCFQQQQQPVEDGHAAAAAFALLSDGGFQHLAAPHLATLLGAPCSAEGGKSAAGQTLHHFSPAAFPGLRRLQLYVPPHQQVLSLRNPAWLAAAALRQLSLSGRHYCAVRALPPALRCLEVSAWHVLVEPQLLVRCPKVRWRGTVWKGWWQGDRQREPAQHCSDWSVPSQIPLSSCTCALHASAPLPPPQPWLSQVHILAAAVLLTEHILPYPAVGSTPAAAEALLAQLVELLAAACLPQGHVVTLDTNLVCWQRHSDGADAKLAAPAAEVLLGAAAAGAAAWQLQAGAGGVAASMAAPPAHSAWPAALGPNAPSGSGPEMRVMVQRS